MPADSSPTRRTVLGLGSAAGGLLLAGCAAPATTSPGSNAPGPSASGGAPTAGATTSIPLSDVPVGATAGATLDGSPILLAQPQHGTVVAFSAVCPHQGCAVEPAGSEFDCPCHGSRFAAATGDVLGGPAPRGLTPLDVSVTGDTITVTA